MIKKHFGKVLIVLAIMITLATLFSVSALAVAENTVMTVYTRDFEEEIYKEFDNFEDGWVFIYEKFPTYFDDFDVKLYADWVAPDGRFYYTNADGKEAGTNDGRLFVESHHFQEGGHINYNKINFSIMSKYVKRKNINFYKYIRLCYLK